jgi:hypothetical protein
MFSPSVQSAQRLTSVATWSPRLSPPRTLSSEKLSGLADESGSGESARASCESEGIGSETFGGKAQVFRAISPI